MNDNRLSNLMYATAFAGDERHDEVCHICLKKGKLSREHVPPQSAFNKCDALWDRLAGAGGGFARGQTVLLRGGLWVPTLCESCNSGVCSPYASAYVEFVRHLVESPRLYDSGGTARAVRVPCDTLYLAKQIAAMILAVEPTQFAIHNGPLRQFVLSRTALYQPQWRVYAFLVPDDPRAGTLTRFHGRVATFAPDYGFIGGEISRFPFGILYAADIGKGYGLHGLTDVTWWFTRTESADRTNSIVSLHTRLTGVDSIQSGLGRNRIRPQIDYLR